MQKGFPNLATLADIVKIIQKPETYLKTNVDGKFHVLHATSSC
jgi:hypothetical protein